MTAFINKEYSSPLLDLPTELWLNTISYLNITDLKNVRLSCRFFDNIARQPLITKSKILISLRKYEKIKEQFLPSTKIFPFHTVEIRLIHLDNDLIEILDKCVTDHLRSLKISNAKVFEWLGMKSMPNLKEFSILWTAKFTTPLKFSKDWHPKVYTKLKTISVLFYDPDHTSYPHLLRLLYEAGASLPLKELKLTYFDHYDDLVTNVFKLHADNLDFIELDFMGPPITLNMKNGSKLYEELRTLFVCEES